MKFLVWLTAAMLATAAQAQEYPSKPIRFIVPFPPGGSSDLIARVIAPRMTERMGQPVLVENRPGAGGMIGVDLVAKAPPDGYTIGLAAAGALSSNISLYPARPYHRAAGLAPISMLAMIPFLPGRRPHRGPIPPRLSGADQPPQWRPRHDDRSGAGGGRGRLAARPHAGLPRRSPGRVGRRPAIDPAAHLHAPRPPNDAAPRRRLLDGRCEQVAGGTFHSFANVCCAATAAPGGELVHHSRPAAIPRTSSGCCAPAWDSTKRQALPAQADHRRDVSIAVNKSRPLRDLIDAATAIR